MKNYNIFKGYFTKTIFDPDTQRFEQRRVEQEDDDDSLHGIQEAPLALAFMVVGLQRSTKRNQRF
jgi:hypothetical protein